MNSISIFGVFVADLCFFGNKIPTRGETVLGNNHLVGPGGKGSNQAIAAARLEGNVKFITKIGKDSHAEMALSLYKEAGVNTESVIQDPSLSTGVAGIMIDENGHNAINIVAGAAGHLQNIDIDKNLDVIKDSKIFLTQMETPDLTTMYALKKAKENNCLTILNPAPARKIQKEDFSLLDFFTPNETEAEFYLNKKIDTKEDIQNAAKVFSGIKTKPLRDTLDPDTGIPMGYVNTGQHDTTDKIFSSAFNNQTISGQSTQQGVIQEVNDFVEMIFSQQATAKSYCRKLYRFYVKSEWSQEVEDDIITPLSSQLIANNFNLHEVLETLLMSQHFYDEDSSDNTDEIIGSVVKSPLQLISETLQLLDISLPNPEASATNPPATFSDDQIYFHKFYYNFSYLGFFASTGINPFSPETVAGYPAMYQTPSFDRNWFSSNTVIGRYKLIECLITGRNNILNNNMNIRVQFNSVDYVENSGNFSTATATDATTLVTEIAELLYCESIDSTRITYFVSILTDGLEAYYWNTAWNEYLQTGNTVQVKIRLDALFTAMINAAEFQLM